MGFGDFSLSMLMRDTIEKLVIQTVESVRPRYRYAVVNTIDRVNYKCTVTYNGETNPVEVSMGSTQPSIVGQTVRIEGIGTDKFITEVIGNSEFSVPTGVVLEFGGTVVPAGFLMADGASKLVASYPDLFDIIGYTYGGSGLNFNIPNRKGRVGVGRDTAQTEFNTLAETGGAKTHVLSVAELAWHNHDQFPHNHTQDAHNHTQYSHGHTGTRTTDAGLEQYGAGIPPHNSTPGVGSVLIGETTALNVAATAVNQAATAVNQATGNNVAHNNLQPYITLNYIIKT